MSPFHYYVKQLSDYLHYFSLQVNGKPSVATVSEVHVDERTRTIEKAAKELKDVWMPHAKPVRQINTSTK